MSKLIITYETFKSQFDTIEKNLRDNVSISEDVLEAFEKTMDCGDFADKSLHFVLRQNLSNAKQALDDFIALPISGYND